MKRALLSVSDKTGVVEFARGLIACGFELVSTGGTAEVLVEAGLTVAQVSEVTGFPEMMDGRVKTLHPKIHGGILGRRGTDDAVMSEHGISPIDMVVVNLYPFEDMVAAGAMPEQCIENIGVGFMFAPAHHSAMKHAIGARKELGIKTIFNLLGPLTNPAGPLNQVLGVFDNKWVRPIAEVLKRLGSKNVLVLHSQDGLDEISTASSTSVAELRDGKIKEYSISPSDFGFKTLAIEGLRVSSPEESLQIAKEALKGENQAAAQMVAMTSGAALYVAGLADTLKVGVDISMEGIKKGIGLQKLDELVSFSQSLKHRG